MKRYEAKKGILSCWQCGSENISVFERLCSRKPYEPLLHFVNFVQCKDCGCSTGCHEDKSKAILAWNSAYSTPEEVAKLGEYDAVSLC